MRAPGRQEDRISAARLHRPRELLAARNRAGGRAEASRALPGGPAVSRSFRFPVSHPLNPLPCSVCFGGDTHGDESWHGRGAVPSEVGPLRASLEKKKEARSAGKCRCMPAGRCMENKKSSLNDCRFCHRLLFSLGQNLNILKVIKKSIWQESSSSEILQGMSIHSLRQHFGDGHVKQARHLPLFSKF